MTSGPSPLQYRRLRAPREDRSALIEPPLGEVGAMVAANIAERAEVGRRPTIRGLVPGQSWPGRRVRSLSRRRSLGHGSTAT